MALERTLSIIKPDAVKKNVVGQILGRFEKAGLRIVAARMMHLSRAQAEGFYAVHRSRPFFKDLVEFMISGPVLVQVLEGENAIAKNRAATVWTGGINRYDTHRAILLAVVFGELINQGTLARPGSSGQSYNPRLPT